LAKDDVLVLLDASMDPGKIKEIRSIAADVKGVKGVHDLKVRRSGPFVFAELHLETQKGISVQKASDITEAVNKAVKNKIRNLDTLTVQIEPYKKLKLRVAIPVENKKGLQSEISEHFARAPFILIADVLDGEIKDLKIKKNPGIRLEKKKGLKTVEFLVKENVDVLIGNEVGEGPRYALNNNLIDLLLPKGETLEETILNVYQ